MVGPGVVLSDKYELVQSLGKGGMGEVYLAEHRFLEKPVAIKVLQPDIVGDDDAVRRFYREAQAAAALRHRGIVDVYDVGWTDDGTPYIVMEYLEGHNLDEIMAEEGGRLDPEYAAEIASQILAILAAVHERGIVHRDIKPENVFIAMSHGVGGEPEAVVKLLDFGVSKMVKREVSTQLTQVGELVGSIPYMAPEQVRGDQDLDHRVDLWGVGAVLYRAITGSTPFTAKKPHQVLLRIMRHALVSPRALLPEVPEALDTIICKALEKEPKDRYPSAAQFRSDLLGFLDHVQRDRRSALVSKSVKEEETFTNLVRLKALAQRRAGEGGSSGPKPGGDGAGQGLGRETPTPREDPRVHCVRVVRGLDAGTLVRVSHAGLVAGRSDECDLRLADENVSRRHLQFKLHDDECVVEDLGSKNGICVNGAPTIKAVLREGDQILVGGMTVLAYARLDSEDVEHHEQVYDSIALDILTGALNRRSVEARLAAEWSFARRHDVDLSVVVLDIDQFKRVNEAVGDQAGDLVLRELARMIRTASRGEDILGRLGGEEFLIICPGVGSRGALRFAKRIRKLVAKQRFSVGEVSFRLTVSMGVASFKGARDRWPQDLVAMASSRLAAAKQAGGNREVGG